MKIRGMELMTLAEAARFLRISKSTIYRECKRGHLRTLRFGGVVRVQPEDLRRFVAQAARRTSQPDKETR